MIKRITFISVIIILAAWQSSHLGEIRRSRMTAAYRGYNADAPPALNFIMAGLGGFRGLVAEVLWFRVNRLQEERRYMELVQLSEWITMLDPHASDAWTYNAWNLSYNISVMMVRHEDRLRWVKNGISILRDDALRYNPKAPEIFRELAWIYQNKIGADIDAAHIAYKLDLATSMQPLLDSQGGLLENPESRAALKKIKMDADLMEELEQEFGKLDWRLANAHALYWAAQGVANATGSELLLCRRALYQPLMLMTFHGRFTGDLSQKRWECAPNLDFAIPTARYMKTTLDLFPTRNMRDVYLRFLDVAIKALDSADKPIDAHYLYNEFCAALPSTVKAPSYAQIISNQMP